MLGYVTTTVAIALSFAYNIFFASQWIFFSLSLYMICLCICVRCTVYSFSAPNQTFITLRNALQSGWLESSDWYILLFKFLFNKFIIFVHSCYIDRYYTKREQFKIQVFFKNKSLNRYEINLVWHIKRKIRIIKWFNRRITNETLVPIYKTRQKETLNCCRTTLLDYFGRSTHVNDTPRRHCIYSLFNFSWVETVTVQSPKSKTNSYFGLFSYCGD